MPLPPIRRRPHDHAEHDEQRPYLDDVPAEPSLCLRQDAPDERDDTEHEDREHGPMPSGEGRLDISDLRPCSRFASSIA